MMKLNKNAFGLLLSIAIVGVLSAGFHISKLPVYIVYSDIKAFYNKAIEPGLPYVDKIIEYPILTGLFIHLMGILGQDFAGYYVYSTVFLTFFAIITTYFLYSLIDRKDEKRIIVHWILAPSMFFFLIYNWDVITLLFVTLALYNIKHDKDYFASLFLALGFCSKFYPVIYLVPILIKKQRIIERIKTVCVFCVTTLTINIFFMIFYFNDWLYLFNFISLRSPNPDSIWGVISRLIPLSIPQINIISLFFFTISSLVLMLKFKQESTIKLFFIITLNFLIFNKFFSPQYLLWLLPFFVLLPMGKRKLFYALELSNLIAFFGRNYYSYTHAVIYLYTFSFFVVLRHIVLILLLMQILGISLDLGSIRSKLNKYE